MRLDAAVPETVAVNVPFDLVVAVRRPEAPPLRVDELTRTRSGAAEVEWPAGVSWVDLRVHVHAPDCRIAGQPFQLFRLHRDRDSLPVYFSLTPQREGEIPIRITLFQAFMVVGNARLWAIAGERVAGQVETYTASVQLYPEAGPMPGVYSVLISAFSMEELATLAAGLGIDFDNLTGTTKQRKASELVAYCERHGRSEDLIAAVIAARPNWMELI